MKVKICGIKDAQKAIETVESGADALGFVFAESKRQIGREQAKTIISCLPSQVMKVGVFVNETKESIEEIAHYCGLTHIQLHGDESPEFCDSLSLPVIKALNINGPEDIKRIKIFNHCSFVLLDSPKGKFNGGTGISFEWKSLESAGLAGTNVVLAGGLNPGNVKAEIRIIGPAMVDVSSGVETEGIKDMEKIRAFIQAAKEKGGVTI